MRFAICNELFTDPQAVGEPAWDWKRQCEFVAEVGYDGLEVAPFTLGESPTTLSSTTRDALRHDAEQAGVEIIGLHWLLAHTTGFHLTADDQATQKRTTNYLNELIRLCGDLGGRVMVFGSPRQRNFKKNISYEQAESNAVAVLSDVVETLATFDVTLCLEPLGRSETNFMTTCAAAQSVITRVGSPHVQLHQDVKAMADEPTPIPRLISEFAAVTKHFHANDPNLRGPGMGDVDFTPIFQALHDTHYDLHVSVEVFDYAPGAAATARQSLSYMRETLSAVSS